MKIRNTVFAFVLCAIAAGPRVAQGGAPAGETKTATGVINALGIELLKGAGKPDANAVLSPYSTGEALGMVYAGASGKTREEMRAALHFPKDDEELNASFSALRVHLDAVCKETAAAAKRSRGDARNVAKEPITLETVNRIFAQQGSAFRKPFLDVLKSSYDAPLGEVDFGAGPGKAAGAINDWVADLTQKRIPDFIPADAAASGESLVLVDAIYFKAQWRQGFFEKKTAPAPFHVAGGEAVDVPTMRDNHRWPYEKRKGYSAFAIPYADGQMQFLVLLPDEPGGLAALEQKLTPALLAGCANLPKRDVTIHLPKFKIEPPVMRLSGQLKTLGIGSAFGPDASFSRMSATGKPSIGEVFHKAFISVDERGTEAAASTAIELIAYDPDTPVEVNVDHPFLFAVQDLKSGVCLFIGRVTDPR
ncbi:MAG TPA: serpin family protein [Chthoniobacteraceae bacterium]|nr:serpin family protein [Chthoniobacteraceae bacterium]